MSDFYSGFHFPDSHFLLTDYFSPAEASLLRKIIRRGLVENNNDLIIQREDPDSPLYSVKKFEDLRL